MSRRTPRSTRTDTPFPCPTLFRSCHRDAVVAQHRREVLDHLRPVVVAVAGAEDRDLAGGGAGGDRRLPAVVLAQPALGGVGVVRSEEHTSELQSLMRISYAVFCLKKKKN